MMIIGNCCLLNKKRQQNTTLWFCCYLRMIVCVINKEMNGEIIMKKSLIIVMLATLLLTGLAHSAPPVAAQVSQPEQNENLENGGWEFRRSWGGEGSNLEGTGRLAIFNQEKLHLIQRGKCRLTIFDTKNETYNVIDVTKNIDTCVKLGDLAIDPNGFIYDHHTILDK